MTEEAKNWLAAIMSAASDRGFVIHEETQAAHLWRHALSHALTAGEPGMHRFSRFTCLLPDTRLISCVRYEERAAALISLAKALEKELPKFEPRPPRLQNLSKLTNFET